MCVRAYTQKSWSFPTYTFHFWPLKIQQHESGLCEVTDQSQQKSYKIWPICSGIFCLPHTSLVLLWSENLSSKATFYFMGSLSSSLSSNTQETEALAQTSFILIYRNYAYNDSSSVKKPNPNSPLQCREWMFYCLLWTVSKFLFIHFIWFREYPDAIQELLLATLVLFWLSRIQWGEVIQQLHSLL